MLRRSACLLIALVLVSGFLFVPPFNGGSSQRVRDAASNATASVGVMSLRDVSLAADPQQNTVYNSSTVIASPPPRVPDTTPVTLNLVSNFVVHRGGLNEPAPVTFVSGQTEAPARPPQGWALIELMYTGNASGTVYDSGYSLNVDNNTLFWGSSPEYGNWTVYGNLTIYNALFSGIFTWQWNSPGSIVNGTFVTSITLRFYPADANFSAPATPNLIMPLLPSMSSGGFHISPSHPTVYGNATVPSDVSAAILQIWVYGFSFDEFWYSNEPSFRDVIVNVSGQPVWSLLPFPYINTGGIDLFAWRPITGVYTLNDRIYMENITAALGMIEGTHEWSFNMPVLLPSWSITASLLLYTNPNVVSAHMSSYAFNLPDVSTSQSGIIGVSPLSTFNQTASASWFYSSDIYTSNGYTAVSLNAREEFSNLQDITPVWENLTGDELTQITQNSVNNEGGMVTGGSLTTTLINYPLAMDTFFEISITHTTNGGFPEYGNASFGLTNLTQAWIQHTYSLSFAGAHASYLQTLTSDAVNSDSDVVVSNLTLISPTAGILGAITHVQGFTGKAYSQVTSKDGDISFYIHLLQAGSLNITPPNYVQPLLLNAVIQGSVVVVHVRVSDPGKSMESVLGPGIIRRALPTKIA
ncbi:MAG: peptide-N4-asparagine amidase [Methanomassiliicoccales archaeon]